MLQNACRQNAAVPRKSTGITPDWRQQFRDKVIEFMTVENAGRIMALDLGEKRIGVAVSDETRLVASSHSVINRKSKREDFARYQEIIDSQGITLLVMGLPITLGGEEGQRAKWVRGYAAEMEKHLSVPIVFWDESLSTVDAQASLRARGKTGKKLYGWVDAAAAAFILQSYLDAHLSDRRATEQGTS